MQRASVVGHANYPWREVDDSEKEWDEEFSLTGAKSENKSVNRREGLDRLSSVAYINIYLFGDRPVRLTERQNLITKSDNKSKIYRKSDNKIHKIQEAEEDED